MDKTYTVLIVDDSFEDRFILKRYLKKTGLQLVILEAGSGAEGIELLTTPVDQLEPQYRDIQAPVMLFLDVNMPLMNGWQFVEELARREKDVQLKPTLILMYSTSDAEHEKSKAAKCPSINSYIVKGESTPESLKQSILKATTDACDGNA